MKNNKTGAIVHIDAPRIKRNVTMPRIAHVGRLQ